MRDLPLAPSRLLHEAVDISTSVDLPQSQPLPLPSPTVWPWPGVSKVISFSQEEAEESQKFPYINAIPPPPTGKTGQDIQNILITSKGKPVQWSCTMAYLT